MKILIKNLPTGFAFDVRAYLNATRTVYAVTSSKNGFRFYVDLEIDDFNPVPLYEKDLELLSGELDSSWRLHLHTLRDGEIISILSFPEWASDPYFYHGITDGKIPNYELYLKWKDKVWK
jgi:hypothetical protein